MSPSETPAAPQKSAAPSDASTLARRTEVLQLSALFAAFYFAQGICEPTAGLLSQPIMSLLKQWGNSAGEIGRFTAIMGLPWSLKLLYGLLTDFVPLGGSRRRSYLLLMSACSIFGLGLLALIDLQADDEQLLLVMLIVSTVGVAFCDVVVDAVMIQRSQPLRLTGRIQSVQWTSIYAASISAALLGGVLSGQGRQSWAFAICAGMAAVTFVLTLLFVKEKPVQAKLPAVDDSASISAAPSIIKQLKSSHALPIAAFLYLWTFNPFSHRVLYVYATEHLGFSETLFGRTESVMAVGQMVGAMAYGFYCRRLPRAWLVHLSIVTGIVATGAYWWLSGERSAYLISLGAGLAYSTGNMVQLDLAARHCPPAAAGTMFALLMAVSNFGISSSEWLGGSLFDRWLPFGPATAFHAVVAIGCATTAGCWLLFPWLKSDGGAITD